jgi:hypothetical protein
VFNPDAFNKELTKFRTNSKDPVAIKYRTKQLTDKYSTLTDDSGNPLFNNTALEALAKGTYTPAYLDSKVKSWAENKLLNSNNYAFSIKDTTKNAGIKSLMYQEVLQGLMTEPSGAYKFTYPKTYTDKIETATKANTVVNPPVTLTDEEKAAKVVTDKAADKALSDKVTADALATAKVKQTATGTDYTLPKLTAEEAMAAYNPDQGVWHGDSKTNSPFGGVLQGLIEGYKNPYAAGNTNPTSSQLINPYAAGNINPTSSQPINREKPVIYQAPAYTNNADGGQGPVSSGIAQLPGQTITAKPGIIALPSVQQTAPSTQIQKNTAALIAQQQQRPVQLIAAQQAPVNKFKR